MAEKILEVTSPTPAKTTANRAKVLDTPSADGQGRRA